MKHFFCIILLIAISASGIAQSNRFYLSPAIGTIYYVGDLKDHALPSPKYLNLFAGLWVKYKYNNFGYVAIGAFTGRLKGADAWGERNAHRDFRFRSHVHDFNIMAKLNVWNWKQTFWGSPGLLLGVGYFNFNPQLPGPGGWIDAQPLGTEGQNIGGSYPAPYELWQWNVKYGVELTFHLNEQWDMALFAFYNNTFTDYIDDVSGVYPDYNELVAAPNGELAAQYTYRLTSGGIVPAGQPRGNPNLKDGYMNIGVSFSRRIFNNKNKIARMTCPAYKM